MNEASIDAEVNGSLELHELISSSKDVDDAVHKLSVHYGGVFTTYHHVQTSMGEVDAPFVRTTYPPEWVSRYLMKGYVQVDPVVQAGLQRQLPFEWSDLDPTNAAVAMMMDAMSFGIGTYGFSVPVVDRSGRRALFSINSKVDELEWGAFIDRSRESLIEAAHLLHRIAVAEIYGDTELPFLSAREREVLMWTARGKDGKSVAIILGISDHTAKGYLKSIRYKLGCQTIAQAVAIALKQRIISD